jgi:hypothetical protein
MKMTALLKMPYLLQMTRIINFNLTLCYRDDGQTIMKTRYEMGMKSGYGQYYIQKTTPAGKTTRVHCTDSQMWDDQSEGKLSQRRLKRVFDSKL